MGKFVIQPHGRLQEWIADEKGYFRIEGLDYEFKHGLSMASVKRIGPAGAVAELRSGAFESYKSAGGNKGEKSDISCACHWTVNQAAAQNIGTMWRKCYVATPGGIMVPPNSPIKSPEDLAGQDIAVGYHSGSHFTTIQGLEPFLNPGQIKLKFVGSVWARVDVAVGHDVPATSVWGLTKYPAAISPRSMFVVSLLANVLCSSHTAKQLTIRPKCGCGSAICSRSHRHSLTPRLYL